MAARTRSFASCTAVSGNPTMANAGSPPPTSTSTSMGYASRPCTAADRTLASTRHPPPHAFSWAPLHHALAHLSHSDWSGPLGVKRVDQYLNTSDATGRGNADGDRVQPAGAVREP